MPAKNGRSGALLRNDEFVDKVYRILEMICEARGARCVRSVGVVTPISQVCRSEILSSVSQLGTMRSKPVAEVDQRAQEEV